MISKLWIYFTLFIALGQHGHSSLTGEDMRISSSMRSAITRGEELGDRWKWPNGVIYVYYDPQFTEREKTGFDYELAELELNTCLQFYVVTDDRLPVNYINVTKGQTRSGSWSWTGFQGGAQQLNLDTTEAGSNNDNFLHMLMHAIGSFHEHSRSDRDTYVTVHTDNIEDVATIIIGFLGGLHNFEKFSPATVKTHGLPYDYNSVMHYPSNSYAKDSSISTIESKTPGVPVNEDMPEKLTAYDVIKINRAYKGVCYEKRVNSFTKVLFDKADKLVADIAAKPYAAPLMYTRLWIHEGSANLTGCGFTFNYVDSDSEVLETIPLPMLTETLCDDKVYLMSVPRPSQSYTATHASSFGRSKRLEIRSEGTQPSYVQVACFGYNTLDGGPRTFCVNQQLLQECHKIDEDDFDIKFDSEYMRFDQSSKGILKLKGGRGAFDAFDRLRIIPNDPDYFASFCAQLSAVKGSGDDDDDNEEEDESTRQKANRRQKNHSLKSEFKRVCPAYVKSCSEHGCGFIPTEHNMENCK